MLKAEKIYKSYGQLEVLKGIDFEIKKGEIVALVGSSGAGKSTLLQILGTLDFPDKGDVYFEGENITKFGERQQAEFRNKHLGFVFQFHHLLPEFTAIENICIPAYIAGKNKKEVDAYALELLDYFKLSGRTSHKPSELSGGEQQRVALARALINRPSLLLADEPTGNLDSQNGEAILSLISNLSKDFDITFLIATHNEQYANRMDRTFRMIDGQLDKTTSLHPDMS